MTYTVSSGTLNPTQPNPTQPNPDNLHSVDELFASGVFTLISDVEDICSST